MSMLTSIRPFESEPTTKGWHEKAKEYYKEYLLMPRLNGEEFVKKLNRTFLMKEVTLNEFPENARRVVANMNSGRVSCDRAWIILSNEESRIFECQLYSDFEEDRNCLSILYYRAPSSFRQEFFNSHSALLSAFLIYYRGIDPQSLDAMDFDAKEYLESLHGLLQKIKSSRYRMRRIFMKNGKLYAYRKETPSIEMLPEADLPHEAFVQEKEQTKSRD